MNGIDILMIASIILSIINAALEINNSLDEKRTENQITVMKKVEYLNKL